MNLLKPTFLFFILAFYLHSDAQKRTINPDEFLPHPYGQILTEHHLIVDYFKSIAEINPWVRIYEYGRSYQNRPLIYAVITSPDNQKVLEEIQKNNLIKTGLVKGTPNNQLDKSIVWLSLGVHGNEAGATESSIGILNKLTSKEAQNWLDDVVVILDPCLNPDGYNRYVTGLAQHTGKIRNMHKHDQSHHEDWPNGRVNHYQHDLNRDWVWATQLETKARLQVYRQFMPHIHADFHELFPDNHSYFPPAAEPYHPYITDHQRHMEDQIGRHHAEYFDQNRWSYFTKERFDLFYPAYGDTYPTING